jgi:hypothetical protein
MNEAYYFAEKMNEMCLYSFEAFLLLYMLSYCVDVITAIQFVGKLVIKKSRKFTLNSLFFYENVRFFFQCEFHLMLSLIIILMMCLFIFSINIILYLLLTITMIIIV